MSLKIECLIIPHWAVTSPWSLFCGPDPQGMINSSSLTPTYSYYVNVYGLSEYFALNNSQFVLRKKTGQDNQPNGKQCIIYECMIFHAECTIKDH